MSATRRITKELADLNLDPASGIRITPAEDSIMNLIGTFTGPPDTPYASGTFTVNISLPPTYPFVPPKMKFATKVWHPNVSSQTGAICLDTLAAKWTPVLTLKTALLSLQALLAVPEPRDPQDAEVAGMMLRDPIGFERKAKEWAVRFAGADPAAYTVGAAGAGEREAAAKGPEMSEEERKRLERLRVLEGYDERLVGRFEELGFEAVDIVGVLKSMGVRQGQGVGEDMTERVVEGLLSL